jgi:Ca2+-binding RTX toxin-like protein
MARKKLNSTRNQSDTVEPQESPGEHRMTTITTNTSFEDIDAAYQNYNVQDALNEAFGAVGQVSGMQSVDNWGEALVAMAAVVPSFMNLDIGQAILDGNLSLKGTTLSLIIPKGTDITPPLGVPTTTQEAIQILATTGKGSTILNPTAITITSATFRIFNEGVDVGGTNPPPSTLPSSGMPADTQALLTVKFGAPVLLASLMSDNADVEASLTSLSYQYKDGSSMTLTASKGGSLALSFTDGELAVTETGTVAAKMHLWIPSGGGEGPAEGHYLDLGMTIANVAVDSSGNITSADVSALSLNDGLGHTLSVDGLTGLDFTEIEDYLSGSSPDVDGLINKVLEHADGTVTVQSSAVNTTLENYDTMSDLVLLAGAANGTGNGEVNTITGNSANNVLDGKAGADTLIGGAGNDTYIVDDAGDVVSETNSKTHKDTGGIDTINSSVTHTLENFVENLNLTGSNNINGTGNALKNTIIGNSGDNTLDGGAGDDTLDGGAGTDVLTGGAGKDTFILGNGTGTFAQHDTITDFKAGEDKLSLAGISGKPLVLSGSVGSGFSLDPNAGSSFGGTVNSNYTQVWTYADSGHTYLIADVNGDGKFDSSDLVVEFDGKLPLQYSDFVAGTISNLQSGFDGDGKLAGGTGDDVLDGSSGSGAMAGGKGNDTYIVGDASTVISEGAGAGTDTVILEGDPAGTGGYVLGANLENLDLSHINSVVPVYASGNNLNNAITGSQGSDVLVAGTGNDTLDGGDDGSVNTLVGGKGNDTYIVWGTGDTVVEQAAEGTDLVQSHMNYVLTGNVENLTLLSDALALEGTGNALNNVITGNDHGDILSGLAGNDTLNGGAGEDLLIGGDGVDKLVGNAGDDVLVGGGGAKADADTMTGGTGDDTYFVDNKSDKVVEAADGVGPDAKHKDASYEGGSDTVNSTITTTLAANVENLNLGVGYSSSTLDHTTGTSDPSYQLALNGTGNALDNVIHGNAGVNTLNGAAGKDELHGGDGNDILIGGLGNDTLYGDDGSDTFKFDAALTATKVVKGVSTTTENVDTIADFSGDGGDGDVLQLSSAIFKGLATITASETVNGKTVKFKELSDGVSFFNLENGDHLPDATTKAGKAYVYYADDGEGHGALYYDADGSGAKAAIKFAELDGIPTLHGSDFHIV